LTSAAKLKGQGRDADHKSRVAAGLTEYFDEKLASPVRCRAI